MKSNEIILKVELIKARVDILKLKADQYNWACYVPDNVKESLEKTLVEIDGYLSGSTPIEHEWNLYHDMDNRNPKDVERIKELEDSVKSLTETLAQFADQLPSPKVGL